METKNPPQASMAGFDITSFRQERYEPNHTQNQHFCKPSNKKTPPIFSSVLNPRTQHSRLYHIFIGPDGEDRAIEGFKYLNAKNPAVVMYLPIGESPDGFNWSIVEGQTVDILSCGQYSSEVYKLGCALHQFGAAHVFGRVNGDIVHWHSDRLEAA